MLTAGHLLGNRYRLDDRIATGGMGDVWRGTDVVLGRVVAVKVLRTAMLSDPEFAARFYGEARMMAAFRHPGVVEVYDYASADDSDDEQVAYLVMAYVEGEPLSNRVKKGPMDVNETMSIVAQAADALHAAHEAGTVHRDVKPGNLIVKPTGAVVLVDFGVARSAAVTSVTAVNAIVGTALYMAPEQVAKGNVSAQTDIYALGAVAYHCIAGHPPFDGDNALQVALRHLEDDPEPLPPHVPIEVRELIAKAMAKQPADRFASAAEFADAAMSAAGPLDWKRLTGTSMVAPLSPAPPTQAVPMPRDLPLSNTSRERQNLLVPATNEVRRPQRGQQAVVVAVLVMLALIGGLGIAIYFNQAGAKSDSGGPQKNTTSQAVDNGTEAPFTNDPAQPGIIPPSKHTGPKPSLSGIPSISISVSGPPTSPTPTGTPTTTTPSTPTETTTPPTSTTTTPPTTSTSTPPTETTTTTNPGTGAGGTN